MTNEFLAYRVARLARSPDLAVSAQLQVSTPTGNAVKHFDAVDTSTTRQRVGPVPSLIGQRHFGVREAAYFLALKGLNNVAQGQAMRVLRALPPPWVTCQRESRPRSNVGPRAAVRRGRIKAAACFALGHPPTEKTLCARPRITCLVNPGRHKRSQDSRLFALGYDVKPLRGELMPSAESQLQRQLSQPIKHAIINQCGAVQLGWKRELQEAGTHPFRASEEALPDLRGAVLFTWRHSPPVCGSRC